MINVNKQVQKIIAYSKDKNTWYNEQQGKDK